MRHIPALDGVRALAILGVVAFHARVPGFRGGFIGVDLFFVLSGYLITRVLEESPDLARFYWRRARRLVPALGLMLITYLLVYPWLVPGYPHLRDAALAFFYFADYAKAFWGIPDFLRHAWSLAVEEHFYLLWPIVFLRWRPSTLWLSAAYVLLTAWRWCWPDWDQAYHRCDTHATGLVLGCAIAAVRRSDFPAWPGLLILALCCATFEWGAPLVQRLGFTVVELGAAIAILGRPPAWLEHPAAVYLGRLSYGIYLWHYPIMRILRDAGAGWQATMLAGLAGSIVFAALSYHTIESWFRRRGETAPVVPLPTRTIGAGK